MKKFIKTLILISLISFSSVPVKAIVGCIESISCPATISKVVKKTYTPFGSIKFQEDYIIEDDFPHTLPYEPFDEGYGSQNIPYFPNEDLLLHY